MLTLFTNKRPWEIMAALFCEKLFGFIRFQFLMIELKRINTATLACKQKPFPNMVDIINRVLTFFLSSFSIINRGEESCGDFIEAHKKCLRDLGFNVWFSPIYYTLSIYCYTGNVKILLSVGWFAKKWIVFELWYKFFILLYLELALSRCIFFHRTL